MVRIRTFLREWVMNQDERPLSNRGTTPAENASSWERATELLAAALDRPAAERRGWLAGLAGIDETLRAEVLSLLVASERAGDFLTPGEIPIADFCDVPETELGSRDPETEDS
jgi:hypothetical protein